MLVAFDLEVLMNESCVGLRVALEECSFIRKLFYLEKKQLYSRKLKTTTTTTPTLRKKLIKIKIKLVRNVLFELQKH